MVSVFSATRTRPFIFPPGNGLKERKNSRASPIQQSSFRAPPPPFIFQLAPFPLIFWNLLFSVKREVLVSYRSHRPRSGVSTWLGPSRHLSRRKWFCPFPLGAAADPLVFPLVHPYRLGQRSPRPQVDVPLLGHSTRIRKDFVPSGLSPIVFLPNIAPALLREPGKTFLAFYPPLFFLVRLAVHG